MLASSQAVITVSEFSRQEIASHYGIDAEKISVVSNAADDRFRPGTGDPERPYFLAVSSPNEHKNFRRLLAAYSVAQDSVESDLIIIGEQTSSFVAQKYDLPATTRVQFTGRVDDDELVRLYQDARAFIFPSVYEGFGIPPLEAQQCGVPVASSHAASLPEVLHDSVLYFDPLDVSKIAEALTVLDSDAALRARLRQAGFANAAQYSWEQSAKDILSIADRVARSVK